MSRIFVLLLVICIFTFSAWSQTVSGSIGNGSVRRGTTVRGSVVLRIPDGLHVNSNRPGSEYLIPTVVRIKGKGITLSRVTYPRGRDRKFQFTSKILNVYEGKVSFPFRITVPRGFRGKSVTVNATVDLQACTEEVCYPPRKETLKITAGVR